MRRSKNIYIGKIDFDLAKALDVQAVGAVLEEGIVLHLRFDEWLQ